MRNRIYPPCTCLLSSSRSGTSPRLWFRWEAEPDSTACALTRLSLELRRQAVSSGSLSAMEDTAPLGGAVREGFLEKAVHGLRPNEQPSIMQRLGGRAVCGYIPLHYPPGDWGASICGGFSFLPFFFFKERVNALR